MKCSRKEITIQVFGKTTKHGLKSVTVVSESHWQSPVIDSGYTEWNINAKQITINPSKNRIPATHNAVSPRDSGKTELCWQLQGDLPNTCLNSVQG